MAYNKKPTNLLSGFSGKLGNVVIKQYEDKTVMAALPAKSKKKPSAKKLAANELMADAAHYAKTIINNPEWKLAVAIALQIEQGKVYSTLIGDYITNKGEKEMMLKIPARPVVSKLG